MAFDTLFKKYFALVGLGLTGVAAYFQARGVTAMVGGLLGPDPATLSAAPAPPTGAALALAMSDNAEAKRRDGDPILSRNPFDSVTGPIGAAEIPDFGASKAAADGKTDVSDPLHAPTCEGVAVFVVTESTDPLWSMAAIQAAGDAKPKIRRVGDDVAGKQVAFIGYNPGRNSPSVWIEGGGTLCQALLFVPQPTIAAAPAAAPAGSAARLPPGAPAAVPADIASKIQKVSETEYNVDRSVVDRILENQAELMRSARIVPEQENGKVVGVRLFGIRPDTLLGTLGLQNGDRLEAINGFNLASPEKALEAYARLRTASELSVKVNRRGAPVTLELHIK